MEIQRGLAAKDSSVKVVVNARNFGVFRSTFNGLRYSTGDATLVMLPVDLQDPPELLPQFVKLWEDGLPQAVLSDRQRPVGLRDFAGCWRIHVGEPQSPKGGFAAQ